MEHVRGFLEGLGQLLDGDPELRGGLLLGSLTVTALMLLGSLRRRLRRRSPAADRVRMTVKDGNIDVRVGDGHEEDAL